MISAAAAITIRDIASVWQRQWRPVLVDISVAKYLLNVDSSTVYNMVLAGDLRWVWNVSGSAAGRDLRFWMGELLARACTLDQPTVIEAIIGSGRGEFISGITVAQTLDVDRAQILRYVATGELQGKVDGNVRRITRASLRDFLTRRLLR